MNHISQPLIKDMLASIKRMREMSQKERANNRFILERFSPEQLDVIETFIESFD